jgi:hypothetical protein
MMKTPEVSLLLMACALTACGTTDDDAFEQHLAQASAPLSTQDLRVISHNIQGCPGGHSGNPAYLTCRRSAGCNSRT